MKLEKCMKQNCKDCRNKGRCFKEDEYYKNKTKREEEQNSIK